MSIIDPEFGEIKIRKSAWAKYIKFSIDTSGKLAISTPTNCSEKYVKKILEKNRTKIRDSLPVKDPNLQRARDAQKKILTKKAKEYLPYRLDFWAKKFGYEYKQLRFSHANTRWGSRSSSGTISLNIGLMKLPEALRDYVIIHELAHINHMDHSTAFWAEVGAHDPHYKYHEKALKHYTPGV